MAGRGSFCRLRTSTFLVQQHRWLNRAAPQVLGAVRVQSPTSLRSSVSMTAPLISEAMAGRRVEAKVAYQPSLDIPVSDAVQRSIDLEDAVLDGWIPGQVFDVSSVEQIHDIVVENPSRKIVLMCKSKSCRPCKAFTVKFERYAVQRIDTVFMSVIGESSMELRDLMIGLKVHNTPTFLGFWERAIIHRHSGISKERMENLLDSSWQQLAEDLPEKDPGDALLSL